MEKRTSKLMGLIETLYGRYTNAIERSVVEKYLAREVPAGKEEEVFRRLIENYKTSWGRPPDVPEIREAIAGDVERQAVELYQKIRRVASVYSNIAFEDIRAQAAIQAMGGWVEFCNRDPQYERLHVQDFVKYFKMYSRELPMFEYKVLRGIVDVCPTHYIGDEKRIKGLIGTVHGMRKELADMVGKVVKKIE